MAMLVAVATSLFSTFMFVLVTVRMFVLVRIVVDTAGLPLGMFTTVFISMSVLRDRPLAVMMMVVAQFPMGVASGAEIAKGRKSDPPTESDKR